MTLIIDVSGGQAGIDFARARAEGVEAVIVKASGYNTGTRYVADEYERHVDRARAAGLAIGHYYVPGRGDVLAQADWFVDHLHDYRAGDVLALDDEPLDANAVFWLQADAARWHQRVQSRLGSSFRSHWNYFPAGRTRAGAPWHLVTDLGVRPWWAAYGNAPTGHTPDHEPALQGSLPGWDVHQYTDRMSVAGRSVDASFSPRSVADLFGARAGSAGTPGAPVPASAAVRQHTSAVDDGDPGPVYVGLVQLAGKAAGIYSGPVDQIPGPNTTTAETILLARLLNSLQLGRTTTAERDGNPYNGRADRFSTFVWLGQAAAQRRGWYAGPLDGLDGPNSRRGRVRLLAEWLNANA